ncbi:ABC transporter permease [Methylovirgula ligni]|uniref:ABC-2 type transport system permease protein n=1 Tax=Methylovirgula ligni TaxID=569860 RepID=A0A3D9Z3Q1_9HYPH|nr:ABC transporter permease [Methylovirgula ligni]QAY95779.1 ABC transporter permease [Methylovirgula ligni]REF88840.1 ABC-2 type transport system permease protein [Methylovirgula ligni]
MGLSLSNIFWLGTKELRSFFSDAVLLGLVIYAFSLAVYVQAHSNAQEVHNASIGVVDQDNSYLSRQMISSFLPPYFKKPVAVSYSDVDHLLDVAAYTFIIIIPPHFETDVLGGRAPEIQLNIDATAMVQAGLGSGYIEQILSAEIQKYVNRNEGTYLSRSQNVTTTPVTLSVRVMYNPNINTAWFTSVMGIVNNVTMLAIILAGAAVVREREHGTMDHLLVMPVTPFEIAMSKIWANGLVITLAVALSLEIIVKWILHIPVIGSVPLFIAGAATYLFFSTSVGIFLATIARTMPQLGLLYILVAFPMNILSGSNTPLESMPYLMRTIMQFSPSTHFVSFAQSILFRGAGFSVVWRDYLYVAFTGGLFLFLALLRFRTSAAQSS